MNTKRIIIFVTIIISACSALFALEFRFGGSNAFIGVYDARNLTIRTNAIGHPVYRLSENATRYESTVDMLFAFDGTLCDAAGNYALTATKDVSIARRPGYYKSGLFFPRRDSRATISYGKNAFLGNSEHIGSFTIEFAVCPLLTGNAVIFEKMGSYIENGAAKQGGIRASIVNGRMRWEFINFFHGSEGSVSLVMNEGTYLKKDEFHHHAASYDARTGRLVTYIDGMEDEIAYATKTGFPQSEIYSAYFPRMNNRDATIGGGFIGTIDELKISARYKRNFDLHTYSAFEGDMITRVVDFRSSRPEIRSIRLDYEAEKGADVQLYYRVSDRFFAPDDMRIPWTYIPNAISFTNERGESALRGQYAQFRVKAKPDGAKNVTPLIRDIIVEYLPDDVPLTPTGFVARAEDGAVTLSWDASTELDLAGYKVYIGTVPGVYDHARSPVVLRGNATTITIDGLENETLYYFTIAAFDAAGEERESAFAAETFARPKILYNAARTFVRE